MQVARDRNGEFGPKIIRRYAANTNELEEKILGMYARGLTTRDIRDLLTETYGMDVSATTISAITDKVWPLVEAWQNRVLESIYPIIYLDATDIKLRRDGKVSNVAVYIVLGHWVGDGVEGANFWLLVVTDLQNRGVEDVFIACIDGLSGFKEAIQAVFPKTDIQHCIIHQISQTFKYVPWKERKIFAKDLQKIYQTPTREAAEMQLLELGEKWGDNWEDLFTFFDSSLYKKKGRPLAENCRRVET